LVDNKITVNYTYNFEINKFLVLLIFKLFISDDKINYRSVIYG